MNRSQLTAEFHNAFPLLRDSYSHLHEPFELYSHEGLPRDITVMKPFMLKCHDTVSDHLWNLPEVLGVNIRDLSDSDGEQSRESGV